MSLAISLLILFREMVGKRKGDGSWSEARATKPLLSLEPSPTLFYQKSMNQKIFKLAIKNFKKLSAKYDGFVNIGLDNWRGWRFIYDTIDVRKCRNNCKNCPLYLLVKDEKEGKFSAGLHSAGKKDKALFGPQNFLNCKTLKQYENCFVNFILEETNTEREIRDELRLVKNFRIIFSTEDTDLARKEKEFRKSVVNKLLKRTDIAKKLIIEKIIKQYKII